jgi:uncharacterized RDD family membrane protein YckC
MHRAGFGIRFAAAALDALFLYGLTFVASMLVVGYYLATRRPPPSSPYSLLFGMLGVIAVLWLAYVALEVFGRASLAKRIFKLRIAGDDHAPPARGRLLARAVFKYSPLLVYLATTANLYGWLERRAAGSRGLDPSIVALSGLFLAVALVVIGGFFAALGRRRQALHDLVAGTVVLRPGEGPAGFAPIMAVPAAETVPTEAVPAAETVAAPAPPAGDATR